jgi:Suppressor of fused protein (SUFU)
MANAMIEGVDGEAPGWDAIDDAVALVVRDVVPLHWGTGTALPQPSGVWGVSGYGLADHWFFVTYGLSELFTKVTSDPSVSGFGEELTFRLKRRDEAEPPSWVPRLLVRLGELVYERRTPFLPGVRMALVREAGGAAPPALCWAADPEIAPVTTPFGSVQFVTTVGLSSELLAAMRAASTDEVLSAIRQRNPLLVTGGPGLEW